MKVSFVLAVAVGLVRSQDCNDLGTCGLPDDSNCVDQDPEECHLRFLSGDCVLSALPSACPKTCWQCVNATELRMEGVSEEEIAHRYAYSRTNRGPLPRLNKKAIQAGAEALRMSRIMVAMDVYARQERPCENKEPHCPYWANMGECENRFEYMMQSCPLACRWCHEMEAFRECPRVVEMRKYGQEPSVRPGTVQAWREKLETEAGGTNVLASDDTDTWAVLIGTVFPDHEIQGLLEVAETLEWRKSEDALGYDLDASIELEVLTDYMQRHRIRQNMNNAQCSFKDCIGVHTMVQALVGRLTLSLGLSSAGYFEKPLHFVSFEQGQSFAKHHDFRVHDLWKVGGYRVLTMYVGLEGEQDVGFPDEDWKIVTVKPNQVLVWPNVQSGDPSKRSANMASEALAPTGEMKSKGIYLHVRTYPHDEGLPVPCRA